MRGDLRAAITGIRHAVASLTNAADALERHLSADAAVIQTELPEDLRAAVEKEGMHPLMAWRKHRFVSQETLAERAGVKPNTISDIERFRTAPRPKTIVKLAKALGCRPEQISTNTD